jgi:hypothetical protein
MKRVEGTGEKGMKLAWESCSAKVSEDEGEGSSNGGVVSFHFIYEYAQNSSTAA